MRQNNFLEGIKYSFLVLSVFGASFLFIIHIAWVVGLLFSSSLQNHIFITRFIVWLLALTISIFDTLYYISFKEKKANKVSFKNWQKFLIMLPALILFVIFAVEFYPF